MQPNNFHNLMIIFVGNQPASKWNSCIPLVVGFPFILRNIILWSERVLHKVFPKLSSNWKGMTSVHISTRLTTITCFNIKSNRIEVRVLMDNPSGIININKHPKDPLNDHELPQFKCGCTVSYFCLLFLYILDLLNLIVTLFNCG